MKSSVKYFEYSADFSGILTSCFYSISALIKNWIFFLRTQCLRGKHINTFSERSSKGLYLVPSALKEIRKGFLL